MAGLFVAIGEPPQRGSRPALPVLEAHAVLKVAGKGSGLDSMRQMLSARFNRSRKGEAVVKEAVPA